MPGKSDNQPLRKVIGSTGRRNQAIRDFLGKFFGRRRPEAPEGDRRPR
jgi:hypothetical protein